MMSASIILVPRSLFIACLPNVYPSLKGRLYELGRGVDVNLAQARAHYEKSAQLGNRLARERLCTSSKINLFNVLVFSRP